MTVQYLIDSENVGDFWIPLLDLPADKMELVVFYTRNSPHMSYDSLIKLRESDRKVSFIKCYEGTNALDFQLVSELGYRICENEDGRFVIVTNDTGFDAAVKYWRRRKKSVKRITGKECRNPERRSREDLLGDRPELLKTSEDTASLEPEKEAEKKGSTSGGRLSQEHSGQEARLSRPNLRDVERALSSDPEEESLEEELLRASVADADGEETELPSYSLEEEDAIAEQEGMLPSDLKRDTDGEENSDRYVEDASDSDEEDQDFFLDLEAEPEEDQDPGDVEEPDRADLDGADLNGAGLQEDSEPVEEAVFEEDQEAAGEKNPDQAVFDGAGLQEDRVSDLEAGLEAEPASEDKASEDTASVDSDGLQEGAEPGSAAGLLEEPASALALSEVTDSDQDSDQEADQEADRGGKDSRNSESFGKEEVVKTFRREDFDGSGTSSDGAAQGSVEKNSIEQSSMEADDREDAVSESGHRQRSRRSRSRRGKSGARQPEQASEQVQEPSPSGREDVSEESSLADAAASASPDAAASASPDAAAAKASPESPSDEEISRIAACIGADNLAELHNQLAAFYGEQGKEIYLSIRKNPRSIPVLKADLRQKFAWYCEIIFSRSEDADEYPKDLPEYLLGVREKLNNLNSLRYALLKQYGKEKGRRFYYLLKPYAKTMYQM